MARSKQAVLQQTVIVHTEDPPVWYSCRYLRDNIISAYKLLDPKVPFLKYSRTPALADYQSLSRKIRAGKYKKLIFAESLPHPVLLLQELFKKPHSVQEFCIHIGNFSFHTDLWLQVFEILKNKKVAYVVTSLAQRRQLQTFLSKDSHDCIQVCAFPIAENHYYLPPVKRSELRQLAGFSNRDFVLTYAGRICAEKNVNLLIQFLDKFLRTHRNLERKIYLNIAGGFDDFGPFFLKQDFSHGQFFYLWNQWFEKLPPFLKKRIRFLGFLNAKEMNQLLNVTDVFISLSTFHDEDFGLAPLEALSTGCPAILSAWGGYTDYLTENAFGSRSVKLVPVRLQPEGLEIDYSGFEKSLHYFLDQKQDSKIRRQRAASYKKSYILDAIAEKYRQIHISEFAKMKNYEVLLKKHARQLIQLKRQKAALYQSLSSRDPLYKKIYKSYLAVENI